MTDQEKSLNNLRLEIEKLQAENASLLKLASHDVRSPLNKLFALVNLLKMSDNPLSEEQNTYLNNMEMVLSDGLQRMKNLLELRTIENDELKLHLQLMDMGALINRLTREHSPLAERKKIKLNIESRPVETTSDKLAFARIFDQLVSNAIKFSPLGSEIIVSLTAEEDNVLLRITDGGYGIREEEQADLFKKFKVLSTIATGGESKTGIGLFIAQSNASLLGGSISYLNNENSSFTLELPKIGVA